LLAYNSGTEPGAIVSKFSGCPRDGFMHKKIEEGIIGSSQNIGIFRYLQCHSRQIGHWTGYRRTHRYGQCADAIETGIATDRQARILHTGMGSRGLERMNNEMGLLT